MSRQLRYRTIPARDPPVERRARARNIFTALPTETNPLVESSRDDSLLYNTHPGSDNSDNRIVLCTPPSQRPESSPTHRTRVSEEPRSSPTSTPRNSDGAILPSLSPLLLPAFSPPVLTSPPNLPPSNPSEEERGRASGYPVIPGWMSRAVKVIPGRMSRAVKTWHSKSIN